MSCLRLSMLSSLLLLLLLLDRTHGKPEVSDSFDINIGAGYGVGIGQSLALLPKSTTTVTHSTNNHLHQILSDDNARRPRIMVDQFQSNEAEPRQESITSNGFQPQNIVTSGPSYATNMLKDEFGRNIVQGKNDQFRSYEAEPHQEGSFTPSGFQPENIITSGPSYATNVVKDEFGRNIVQGVNDQFRSYEAEPHQEGSFTPSGFQPQNIVTSGPSYATNVLRDEFGRNIVQGKNVQFQSNEAEPRLAGSFIPNGFQPQSIVRSEPSYVTNVLKDEFGRNIVQGENVQFRSNEAKPRQEGSFTPSVFQPQNIVTSGPSYTTNVVKDEFGRNIVQGKSVMHMKEIQKVLHNLDEGSEYSKIVQVVKVPAIYEIHMEKTQEINNRKPQTGEYSGNAGNKPNYNQHHQSKQIHNHAFPEQIMNPVLKHHFIHREIASSKPGTTMHKIQPSPGYYSRPKMSPQMYFSHQRPQMNPKSVARPPNFQGHSIRTQNLDQYSAPKPFHPPATGHHNHPVKPFYTYSTLAPSVPYDVKPAAASNNFQSIHRAADSFQGHTNLKEDFIYGRQVERVSSPDEINITVQPGTTMVTFPREERFVDRSFSGPMENGARTCDKIDKLHKRVDDVFIPTNHPPRMARRISSGPRWGDRVKYYVVINEKYHDADDDE